MRSKQGARGTLFTSRCAGRHKSARKRAASRSSFLIVAQFGTHAIARISPNSRRFFCQLSPPSVLV